MVVMLIVSKHGSFIIQNSRVFDNNRFQSMFSPYSSMHLSLISIVTIYEITYLQIEDKSPQWSNCNIMKFNNG